MPIHDVAREGYRVAGEAYERARPPYPPEAVEMLLGELRLDACSLVVEWGAGTGKLTRMLAPQVRLLVATEPVAAMRAQLAEAVSTPVVAAAAEAVPLRSGCADAVVAATAFHWFQGPEALAEADRVLRPGGGLGLLWNNPDRTYDWVARVWGLVDEHRGATPGNRDMRWQEAFVDCARFTPLELGRLAHRVALSIDDLVARVGSISFIASLPPAEREGFLDQVRTVVAAHPATAGQREIELPYLTDVYWCRKR